MTHNNNNHIEVVEEASFKAGGAKEDVGIGTYNKSKSDSRNCHYCGKQGHWARECRKKESDLRNGILQQNNYASSSKQAEDRYEHLFVMQHMLNTVATNVSTNVDNVWYVDSGAFNHMTYHGEWFRDAKIWKN
jgi:hypothetical protein